MVLVEGSKRKGRFLKKNGQMYSVVRTFVDTATILWREFVSKGGDGETQVRERITVLDSLTELMGIFNQAMKRISLSYGRQVTLRLEISNHQGRISDSQAIRIMGRKVTIVRVRG